MAVFKYDLRFWYAYLHWFMNECKYLLYGIVLQWLLFTIHPCTQYSTLLGFDLFFWEVVQSLILDRP